MTTTFDPFTPAGAAEPSGSGGEQAGYGSRRRTGDGRRTAETSWSDDRGWAAEQQSRGAAEQQSWGAAEQQGWSGGPQGWAAGQQQGWVEPVEPVHSRSWTEDPRWAEERPRETPAQDPWAAPAQRAPEMPPGADRAWENRTWETGSMPAAAGYPADPVPARTAARRPSRTRLAVIGLVAVLVAVAAWQTYRVEGMTTDNRDLASVLTAQKDRTDKLAKQLAGVFDPEAVSSKVLPSVFRVRAGDFTGTAFSVGTKAADGKANLLTNYHVVDEVYRAGGRKVALERGSTQINATIVKVSKTKDLALLQADQTITGLATASAQVKPGQQVVVVGAPLGLDDTVTSGVVSAYRPDDPDGPTIQFDAPINPGNSGGPVVNAADQVVGLATAKAKDAEGIGLAIPIKTACDTFAVC
jgi:putative serine protease PepD